MIFIVGVRHLTPTQEPMIYCMLPTSFPLRGKGNIFSTYWHFIFFLPIIILFVPVKRKYEYCIRVWALAFHLSQAKWSVFLYPIYHPS